MILMEESVFEPRRHKDTKARSSSKFSLCLNKIMSCFEPGRYEIRKVFDLISFSVFSVPLCLRVSVFQKENKLF